MELSELNEPPKPLFVRLQERLAASRFFTFSLLIHVILVFLCGSVVLFKHYAEPPDFSAEGGDGLVHEDVQVQAPPEPPASTTETFAPQTPTLNAPQLSAITTNATATTFQVAAALPVVKSISADLTKAMDQVPQNLGKKGIADGLPKTMGGRAGGAAKAAMMAQNKGTKESEEAVLKGLRWLVKHQNENGSWGPTQQPAMTGFALLSFLGHGDTPVSNEFGATVQKGLDWLTTEGAKYDGRLCMSKDFPGGPAVYAHAIASYALGEYYTMTKDERVAELLKKAAGYIVQGQAPDGGWQYSYAKGVESDTSVTGWQIQALKAAHLTGLNIEGVDASLDKAMLNLKRVQRSDGGFGYHNSKDGNGYSLSGVGVLCTYFWKQDKSELVREGIKNIMDKSEKDYPVEYKGAKANLYAWYYNTQACLMYGGQAWTKWNGWFQKELITNQASDGSWPPIKGTSPGGDLMVSAEGAGPYYRTNLCILMLEVFYRYSPTMK